jgi:hypothetical protein
LKLITIWRIVNEWDPIDILDRSPIDEYKYVINRIYSLFNGIDNIEKLAGGIFDILKNSYANEFNKSYDECKLIAEKIIQEQNIPFKVDVSSKEKASV